MEMFQTHRTMEELDNFNVPILLKEMKSKAAQVMIHK